MISTSSIWPAQDAPVYDTLSTGQCRGPVGRGWGQIQCSCTPRAGLLVEKDCLVKLAFSPCFKKPNSTQEKTNRVNVLVKWINQTKEALHIQSFLSATIWAQSVMWPEHHCVIRSQLREAFTAKSKVHQTITWFLARGDDWGSVKSCSFDFVFDPFWKTPDGSIHLTITNSHDDVKTTLIERKELGGGKNYTFYSHHILVSLQMKAKRLWVKVWENLIQLSEKTLSGVRQVPDKSWHCLIMKECCNNVKISLTFT